MTDQDGHNVNVVYGFFRMLMKIFQENPDYFVITWDSPVKTLRHEDHIELSVTEIIERDVYRNIGRFAVDC